MFQRLSDFIPLSQLSPANDTGPLVLSETLLFFFFLEEREWGAWWASVYGVAQSRTRLK